MITALDLENQIKEYIENVHNGLIFTDQKKQKIINNFWVQIKKYQVEHQISSVYFKTLNWEGHTINCPFYSPFLYGRLSDLQILKENKSRLLKWFLNFATEKIDKEGYSLCQEIYDADGCLVYIPLNVSYLEKIASEFEWVELVNYIDNVSPDYKDDGTVRYWIKSFNAYFRRGDTLDIFEDEEGDSQLFTVRKTFLTDPRE